MYSANLFPLCLLWLAATVNAAIGEKHGMIGMGITMYRPVCGQACSYALGTLYLNCTTFDEASADDMGGMSMKLKKRMDMGDMPMGTTSDACYATDKVWLQSISYCLKSHCEADGVPQAKIAKLFKKFASADETISYEDALPAEAPTVEVEAEGMWLNVTSRANEEFYYSNKKTLEEFEYQEDTHVRLSLIIMVGTVLVCLLAAAYQALSTSRLGSRIPVQISKYLMLPALFNGRHQEPLPGKAGYVPSRIVSLLVALYIFINLLFCAVPYKSMQHGTTSAWYTDIKSEISAYVGNRTGVLSFANIALSILFAGRNNPLMWVTGLSQTTCLIFHRWSARVATVQAVVHSIIYTYTKIWSGGAAAYATEAAMAYWWWGILATIAMALAIVFSALSIRLRMYELFLVIHIMLAILALVGCWYHVVLRFDYNWGYEVWLYIAFAFWGFDRLSRIAITAYRNMGGTTTQAVAELMPGGRFMKITVYPAKTWKFAPGAHAFLYFPSTGRFWENHPFSIATWSSGHSSPSLTPHTVTTSKTSDPEKDLRTTAAPVDSSSTSSISQASQIQNDPRSQITFLIRPHAGLTSSLLRDLQIFSPTNPTHLPLTLEGPYGHAANMAHADLILLMGGGIGITALLGYVQFFCDERRASGTHLKATHLVLAWSYREVEFAKIVRGMLPSDAEAFGVELRWRCTGEKGEEGGEGRMDVGEVLGSEMQGVKRLAVLVCAPGGMADEVRRGVASRVGGGTVVDYFEESFAW